MIPALPVAIAGLIGGTLLTIGGMALSRTVLTEKAVHRITHGQQAKMPAKIKLYQWLSGIMIAIGGLITGFSLQTVL